MLSVLTNLSAMTAMRNNRTATRQLEDSFRKLSSGLRVGRAADDAAGLAVAENLDARARSQRMAMRNTNDGISMIQTAEGGLNEAADLYKRMRELAVQASSETLADTERTYLNDEFGALQEELSRVKQVTEFNGKKLLDGSLSSGINVQVGADATAADSIAITLDDMTKAGGGGSASVSFDPITPTAKQPFSSYEIGPEGGPLVKYITPGERDRDSHPFFAENSAPAIAANINKDTGTHGVTATAGASSLTAGAKARDPGAAMGELEITWGFKGSPVSVTVDLNGAEKAPDVAAEIQTRVQKDLDIAASGVFSVTVDAGTLSIGANDGRSFSVQSLDAATAKGSGFSETAAFGHGSVALTSSAGFEYNFPPATGMGTGTASAGSGTDLSKSASVNLSSVANARAAIDLMDSGLDTVNSQRSKLGAVHNRLNSALNNLQTSTENMFASQSRIRDLDYARESAELARAQVMQQASLAILSQAQSMPQSALRLI